MATCSFQEAIGGKSITCGNNIKVSTNEVVPLLACTKPIATHLSNYHIDPKTVESEGKLLQLRGGLYFDDIDSLTICPNHRQKLGLGWTCGKFCSLSYCCGKNKSMPKGTISRDQALYLFFKENRFVGVGAGVCVKCRTMLLHKMQQEQLKSQLKRESPKSQMQDFSKDDLRMNINTPVVFEASDVNNVIASDNNLDYSSQSTESTVETNSQGSEWIPSSQDSETSPNALKRQALDSFLEMCGVSSVKKTLTTSWQDSSERTKSDYIRKSKQIFTEVLKILTPGQEDVVSDIVLASRQEETVNMLEVVSLAYKQATDWGTQRQILSLIATEYSLKEIARYIPELSKYKYSMARKHSQTTGSGQPHTHTIERREHLSDLQISHFLDFIMSPAVMTDVPFGEIHLKLSTGEKIDVPKIILNSVRSRVVEQYRSFCMESDFQECASDRTYMRILQAVDPSIRKCMKGLDNYAAEGAKAFEECCKVVSTLGRIGMGAEWTEDTKSAMMAAKQYLKMEYKMHVSNQSEIPDHCCQFALSLGNGEFSSFCEHQHDKSCCNCEGLRKAIDSIENAVKSSKVQYESEDQKDEIQYTLSQGCKAIADWKKHILRTVNQDGARTEILKNLSEDEVFIERDWAMKFLPMVYRESQSKWFAKRGINWHISVGSYLKNGVINSHTVVHLFDNATQDAVTSNAILLDTLKKLHEINPMLKKAYIRSDNAGCFHSYSSVFGIKGINRESPISVSRVDFADPQGGKSICDRRAAHLKSTVAKYVNEGNDVRTASEFLAAIKNSNSVNTSIVVAAPSTAKQNVKVLKQCPLKNITSFYNFLFKADGMEVWKQYGIGSGQFIPYQFCFEDDVEVYAVEIVENFNTVLRLKPVVMGKEKLDDNADNVDQPAAMQTDNNQEAFENGIFSCPETNCRSTFTKYGNLMLHLDIGNHSLTKSSLLLSDRAKLSYSSKIETKHYWL